MSIPTDPGRGHAFQDPLYGQVTFDDDLLRLVRTPTVQRLRHVRLSNIDSVDMPSISNLSRMEHVIGVAHLAGSVGFLGAMSSFDAIAFRGAALLHDWAITAFGHLIEEALQYVGTNFDHESRLAEILSNDDAPEIGGVGMQILCGRGTGLKEWATKAVGRERADDLMSVVMNNIRGRGRWGRAISGDIDLDNIDNVYRMAFHLGLDVDRTVPLRIAKGMVGVLTNGNGPIFRTDLEALIEDWLRTRRDVYEHLMLARRDFVGKLMMLSAAVAAFENEEFSQSDWYYVDHQFMAMLLSSKSRSVREPAERWVVGEPWELTPLRWMEGKRPSYPALRSFSSSATKLLGRHCFAYAIKDKRDRRLSIAFEHGVSRTYGVDSMQWLLGIGSSKREAFDKSDVERLFGLAEETFDTKQVSTGLGATCWGVPASCSAVDRAQPWLL